MHQSLETLLAADDTLLRIGDRARPPRARQSLLASSVDSGNHLIRRYAYLGARARFTVT